MEKTGGWHSRRREATLPSLNTFYLQSYTVEELQRVMEFSPGTLAWIAGIWALWLLEAVDNESSA